MAIGNINLEGVGNGVTKMSITLVYFLDESMNNFEVGRQIRDDSDRLDDIVRDLLR